MPENIPFKKKELIVKIHNPHHLPTIDFHEFKEMQGDLKITTPAKIEKLKNSIRKYGIFVPKFVWIDNGTYYIEDGHQTIKALAELEEGGYTVPPIPYVEIQAEDKKEAGEKLLIINSKFAIINPETSFLTAFNIELPFLEEIEIQELTTILDIDYKEEWEGMPEFHQDDKSAYRQLIINFKNDEDIKEFSDKIGQKLTEKTKSIWYPKQETQQNTDMCWESDES